MKKRGTFEEESVRIPIHTEAEEEQNLNEREAEIPQDEERSSEDIVYLRLKADFENLKKRSQKEIEQGVRRELGDFFKKFLPIHDDLERAITYSENNGDNGTNGNSENFREGISLINKRISGLLHEKGVERIEAVGKAFDPSKHEAVMVDHDPEAPENTITEEIQPGYLFKGTLLRPAKVKVAQ